MMDTEPDQPLEVVPAVDSIKNENRLQNHVKEKKFECELCGKRYDRNSRLVQHLHSHHKKNAKISMANKITTPPSSDNICEKKHSCHLCKSSYTRKSHLNRHFRKSHVEEIPLADLISFSAVKTKTSDFENKSSQNNIFMCRICQKCYSSRRNLRRHFKKHAESGETPKLEFVKSNKVNELKPDNMDLNGDKFACKICDKVYLTKSHLKRHYYSHTQNKPFKCDHCGKSFTQKNHLERHFNKHKDGTLARSLINSKENFSAENNGNHMCNICHKTYTQLSSLYRHRRKSHTKDQLAASKAISTSASSPLVKSNTFSNRQCKHCLKIFSRPSRLVKHILIHHKQSSPSKNIKSDHSAKLLLHNGDSKKVQKLHACKRCGKRFTTEANLKKHVTLSHRKKKSLASQSKDIIVTPEGVKRYKCHLCEKDYAYRQHVKRHIQINHSDETNVDGKSDQSDSSEENIPLKSFSPKISKNLLSRAIILIAQRGLTCKICNKSFSLRAHLKEHRLSHVKVEPPDD